MNRNAPKLYAAGLLALALAACSMTSFTSTWRAPDAQPMALQPGDKVVAMVISKNNAMRRAAEANLADQLNARGLVGVPSYSLIGDNQDEANAKQAINVSGAKAVVVMRPTGQTQEISSSPSYYGSPYYGGFYGGYYGYGWGGAWGTEVRTDTYVHIESLVYDLDQNKLVWAGQSKTMNPNDVEGTIAELTKEIGAQLRKEGLIPAKK